ncbi:hypothetical protein IMG5_070100 [Ichthyophthirius multifiliis]|uniref:Uncharacterized protein n=1 Tax=Ichthyophthirius multifiliis TaxID=5932 RepID=G0QPQ0_ICHMU|nr:hypothetical protein IMG5_070100 [Ichthyophthirius multifiliis]EGR32811.1 hypothetical protein IMG5_070100 [Ichthyophthirius multifiliis]|eukprot:XP_004036797.1 hypothetical protein IMG5_070100 [Ichthyophthirius multifiliis]
MVNKDYCVCATPRYRLMKGSQWECEEVHISVDVPKCEWQLFNQIINMVVHSKCEFVKNENNVSLVLDTVTYDWTRANNVILDDECKQQLNSQVLYSRDCNSYSALPLTYINQVSSNSVSLMIPLINVYELTTETVLSNDGRTIYQKICLAIELSHLRRVIRQHRFQIRVYTNRDQVEVFHLTVSKQITDGCDKGQQCIIVANLDTEGYTCKDQSCNSYYLKSQVPSYVVGEHMYVRIQFVDNTYTKYLHVVTVKFVDDAGIYNYVRNVQWWTLRQGFGQVDVDILLFQPHVNAIVEVALKITLEKDNLRALSASIDSDTKQTFQVNVYSSKQQPKDTQKENTNSFGLQLIFGFLTAVLLLSFY